MIGVCDFYRDDAAGAEENLKRAVQKDSDYGDALYFLGSVYTKQKRKPEAIGELNLAVGSRSLSPQFRAEARYNLAQLYWETGKYDQAWKHARIAQRFGYANADQLLTQLARVSSEPTDAGAGPVQGEATAPQQPATVDQPYHIVNAILGEFSGTVRAGQPIQGRVRLAYAPDAKRQVTLSLKFRASSSAYWQIYLFAHLELPEGVRESEVQFMVPWPPSLPNEGEFVSTLAVVAPIDLKTFPPSSLSNEVQVSVRVVP